MPYKTDNSILPLRFAEDLKPNSRIGWLFVFICCSLTGIGFWFSAQPHILMWIFGQTFLAVALLQWFILLHEAGHGTLFKGRKMNLLTGHVASLLVGIPFFSWRQIHNLHHLWTGWQDRDPTTASLVPRKLSALERGIVNFCWKCWVPLFGVLYRIQNFWNIPRLTNFIAERRTITLMSLNSLGVLLVYGLVFVLVGPGLILKYFGLAFLLSLIMQETLLLSQHTHIPMELSRGNRVEPHPGQMQEKFTRTLTFPNWVSKWILMSFDMHGKHHTNVKTPGYLLNGIICKAENQYNWFSWVRMARKMPGEDFLFKNRNQSLTEL